MDIRTPYERANQELAPKWLRRGEGDTWLSVFGKQRDDVRKSLLDAVRNWFASSIATNQGFTLKCANDALIHIAQNHDLERPEILTDDQFRDMILDAWPIWLRSGTELGIKTEIARLGFTGKIAFLPTVDETRWDDGFGNYFIRLAYTTFSIETNALFAPKLPKSKNGAGRTVFGTYSQANEDWDTVAVTRCNEGAQLCVTYRFAYWDWFNYIWSNFFIVIGQPHNYTFWKWGETGLKWGQFTWDAVRTGDRVLLRRIKATLRKFNPGDGRCSALLFHFAAAPARKRDDIKTFQDANGEWQQEIITTNFAAVANTNVWSKFNWGDGTTRFGQGYSAYFVYHDWEKDDSNPPNIEDG